MKHLWCALLTAVVAGPAQGQIVYEIAFPNAVHHEAAVSVALTDLPPRPLEMRMSRSSPGRYAIHEFAKNVYNVRAFDGAGRPLRVERPNPYQWDVPEHDGTVTVRYTIFADRGGGTYAQIDETHAHMNIPAMFMWPRGLGDRPVRITFAPPEGSGWRVASQLMPTDDAMTFTAPNLYYFMDSPTELSAFTLREWEVEGPSGPSAIRLAVHHAGTEAEVDQYADRVARVVAEEIAVYGEPPAYDVGNYTFIADYLPYVSGDGMEHRNSTILASTSSLASNALGLLGTVSHEFFHSWNVERIRPRTLEPFDFERANMSRELWFAEGFTSYYTPLFIKRAGITSVEDYAGAISGGVNFVVNAPGRRYFSPIEMSMQAPFVDAATAIDPTNFTNTFISYYTWGSVIGLNLDLTLRARYDRTLDGFMRAMWTAFGRPEVPYTVDDLERTLAAYTGDGAFAEDFFARFVRGREVPDYRELLAPAGMLLRRARPDAAWLGALPVRFGDDGAVVTGGTNVGTPIYEAGLDRGDRIIRFGGRAATEREVFSGVLGAHRPGDVVEIVYEGRAGRRTTSVTLGADPTWEVVTYEAAGLPVTDAIRAFRDAWLGSHAASH